MWCRLLKIHVAHLHDAPICCSSAYRFSIWNKEKSTQNYYQFVDFHESSHNLSNALNHHLCEFAIHNHCKNVRFNFAARENQNKTKSLNMTDRELHMFNFIFFLSFQRIISHSIANGTQNIQFFFIRFCLIRMTHAIVNGKSVEKSRPHSFVLILFFILLCLFWWIHSGCCCEIQFLCQLNTKWRLNTCRHTLAQPIHMIIWYTADSHTHTRFSLTAARYWIMICLSTYVLRPTKKIRPEKPIPICSSMYRENLSEYFIGNFFFFLISGARTVCAWCSCVFVNLTRNWNRNFSPVSWFCALPQHSLSSIQFFYFIYFHLTNSVCS